MSTPKPTAAQTKAAEKWIKPMLQMLHDPALWAIRLDLLESETPENQIYITFVDNEITARIKSTANTGRRSYEEITK